MHVSILKLNVNDLNAPIKRHGITNWVKKTKLNHMLLTRDSSHLKKNRVKGWKKVFKHMDHRQK
jgi:hypothetical protein